MEHYPKATNVWEARFMTMYDAYMGQTGNLINCDLQMTSLRSWNLQHLEIKYEPRNTAQ